MNFENVMNFGLCTLTIGVVMKNFVTSPPDLHETQKLFGHKKHHENITRITNECCCHNLNSHRTTTAIIIQPTYTMISTIISSSLRLAASSSAPSAALVGRQLSMTATQSASKLSSILEEYRAQK